MGTVNGDFSDAIGLFIANIFVGFRWLPVDMYSKIEFRYCAQAFYRSPSW